MLTRLIQMLIKEFIQVFRDKRTRYILFGPPLIQSGSRLSASR